MSDGKRTARISNGHPLLGRVVGTGCMSSVMVGAFAAVDSDPFMAAVGGLTAFGIAGEMAAQASGDRPGTFHTALYDALYALRIEDIRDGARVEVI